MITTYRLELDAEKHPVLVKESVSTYEKRELKDPETVVQICNDLMRLKFLAEEQVVLITSDIKGCILGIFRISHGSVDMAVCNPREIFIRALLSGASRMFLIHNHPSGDHNPSGQDLQTVRNLELLGKMMRIELADFIVVGSEGFYSAKKEGIVE